MSKKVWPVDKLSAFLKEDMVRLYQMSSDDIRKEFRQRYEDDEDVKQVYDFLIDVQIARELDEWRRFQRLI